jgi:hypothetical protein
VLTYKANPRATEQQVSTHEVRSRKGKDDHLLDGPREAYPEIGLRAVLTLLAGPGMEDMEERKWRIALSAFCPYGHFWTRRALSIGGVFGTRAGLVENATKSD